MSGQSGHITRRQFVQAIVAITTGAVAMGAGLWPQRLSAATRPPRIGKWGFDVAGMDTSVAAGDDFFRYSGGTWVKTTEIPADRSRWGAFDILYDKSVADVHDAIEIAAQDTPPSGSVAQKVVDYFESYIDVTTIDKRGMSPTQPVLERILAAPDHETLVRIATSPQHRIAMPVSLYVTLDAKRPDKYVVGVYQSGLGMPDRDYYLNEDAQFATVREKYRGYIDTVLDIAGYPDPAKGAQAVYEVEHRIAELHWPRAKSRDRDLTYNPRSLEELERSAPGYPWRAGLASFGAADQDFFVVAQADAIEGLAKLFRSTAIDTWRAYVTFHYLNNLTDVLPRQVDEADFDFYGRVINGQLEQRDRWKRAVDVMNRTQINEAVGELYVKHHFSAEDKLAISELVENLRAAYRRRITALPWMSEETKRAALDKLSKVMVKVGYPDKWRDYTTLDVKPGDAFGNREREFAFARARDIRRLSGPADRTEWAMGPQMVNAYYRSTWNEIVFPAAILQPPFFDAAADAAVNYGAIGAVIGHELGHGFDDQGSKTDANGVLRDWWNKDDRRRFAALTEALAAQYSKFEALPGLAVNGKLTLGEAIGDLGGINVALEAYRIATGDKQSPALDGFTAIQRFFLGFSQIWRTKTRPAALRKQVITDPHAPARFRTNGTVRNVDEWYTAFHVTPAQKLYLPPGRRVRIW